MHPSNLRRLVDEIAEEMGGTVERGRVATYVPGLAAVDPTRFGIALVLADGNSYMAGDADERFSIQSISKVFALTLALGKIGDGLWKRVGREPSGASFNSIAELEHESGVPRNPFINPGAIVVSDVNLAGRQPPEAIDEILRLVRGLADDHTIVIDEAVARSEQETGFRNIALANYIKALGNLFHPVEHALGVYFHQCAIAMSCRQLAMAGRFLMRGGLDVATSGTVVSKDRARGIIALMLTCGHYGASGDFAYRVGLPSKSGVGGGILAIAPGRASIAVWSPGLNANGHSLLGTWALQRLSEATGWSVFDPAPEPQERG